MYNDSLLTRYGFSSGSSSNATIYSSWPVPNLRFKLQHYNNYYFNDICSGIDVSKIVLCTKDSEQCLTINNNTINAFNYCEIMILFGILCEKISDSKLDSNLNRKVVVILCHRPVVAQLRYFQGRWQEQEQISGTAKVKHYIVQINTKTNK